MNIRPTLAQAICNGRPDQSRDEAGRFATENAGAATTRAEDASKAVGQKYSLAGHAAAKTAHVEAAIAHNRAAAAATDSGTRNVHRGAAMAHLDAASHHAMNHTPEKFRAPSLESQGTGDAPVKDEKGHLVAAAHSGKANADLSHAIVAVACGDVAGHEFHGNQFTDVGSGRKIVKWYHGPKSTAAVEASQKADSADLAARKSGSEEMRKKAKEAHTDAAIAHLEASKAHRGDLRRYHLYQVQVHMSKSDAMEAKANADLASIGVCGPSGACARSLVGGAMSQPIFGDSARAVPGSGPTSARLEEAQFKRKVKGEQADPKLSTSGTGAAPNKDHLDARAIHLGALAHKDFKRGKNPAGWAVDEDIWAKAKDAALKSYSLDDDAYWPVVAHVYESMGGTVKGEAKANVSLSAAILSAVANDYHPDQARDEGGKWTAGQQAIADRTRETAGKADWDANKATVAAHTKKKNSPEAHEEAADLHEQAAKSHREAARASQYPSEKHVHTISAEYHDKMAATHREEAGRHGDTGNELVGQYYGGKDISNAMANALLANSVIALGNAGGDEVALTLADIPADAPSLANAEAAADGWLRLAPFGDHPHPGVPGSNEPVLQRFDRASAQTILDGFRSNWGRFKRALIGLPIFNGHPDVPGLQHLFKDKVPKGTASDMRIGEDGLYIRPALNPDGARTVEGGADRPSPYWNCRRTGEKAPDGRPIVSPFQLISVGLVPRGNIAGPSLMNAATANSNHQESATTMNNERTMLIQLLTALGQTVSPQVGDTDLANAVQTAIAALPKKDVAEAANALLGVLRGAKLDDKGKLETFLTTANVNATALATANSQHESTAATITTLTAERDTARTEATTAKATATAERKAHSELLANAAVEAGLIPAVERDAWVTALANAEDFAAKAKELTTKKPVVKTTSTAMKLGNVRAGAAAEKSAAKKIQEGVQALMKAHSLPYLEAYANFQSDPANRELFAGLKSDEVKVPNSRR